MRGQDEFRLLYEQWAGLTQQSSWHGSRAVELARQLVNLRPDSVAALDALATSIWGALVGRKPHDEMSGPDSSLASNPLFGEMIDAFTRELSLDRTDSAPAWNRAIALGQAGLHLQAYESYMEAAEIDSGLPSDDSWIDEHTVWLDYYQAARAARDGEEHDLAAEAVRLALEAGGAGDPDAWRLAADIYSRLGRFDEARAAHRRADELAAAEER